MKLYKYVSILVLAGMVLAACTPTAVQPTNVPTVPQPTATLPAAETSTPANTPQADTPTPAQTSTPASGPKPGPTATQGQLPSAVQAAQNALAQQMGIDVDQVKVSTFEAVDWPDGCLGIQMPGRMCTQVITPGYRVVLEVDGKSYEFHTDEGGSSVQQALASLPVTADKTLVWEQTEGSTCSRAEIGSKTVAYGLCGGNLSEARLDPGRAAELNTLLATYAPFMSGTKAGTLQFNGQGTQQASEAEMRSIAEWSKLVFMEAQSGRTGAAWGLAMAWHREGGIAGFCDDLGVYQNGWAMPSTCKGGQGKAYNQYRLSADELEQLYKWVDQFKNFEYGQSDNAAADGMRVTLIFTGQGTADATPEQRAQIAEFASQIYSNATR